MSLKVKLIALFLLAGLIPIIAVSLINGRNTAAGLNEEIIKAMDMYAGKKSEALEDYLDQRAADSRVFAATQNIYQGLAILRESDYDIHAPDWNEWLLTLDKYVIAANRQYDFSQLYLTDIHGRVVYDSLRRLVGQDLSALESVKGALNGKTAWSDLFYSDLVNANVLVVSSPVHSDGLNQTIIGTVNLLFSNEVISQFVHTGVDQLGVSADAYLIDADGLLMTDTLRGDYIANAALKGQIDTRAVELLAAPIGNADFSFYKRCL